MEGTTSLILMVIEQLFPQFGQKRLP